MNDVKHYARPKKSYPKGYILYKSIQILERQTHRARNPFSGSQELGEKLTTEGPEETFWSDLKNVLYHNCGGGYTTVQIYQNLNCISKELYTWKVSVSKLYHSKSDLKSVLQINGKGNT